MLVHSGGVYGDDYCAFIRPDGKQWLKFDDDKVSTAFLWQYSQGNCACQSSMKSRTKEQSAQVPALTGPQPSDQHSR